MAPAVLATCNLNQWAMDFDGNLRRIQRSIDQARRQHARYRIGPELEVTGYGCEDHFLELDTFTHTWECIAHLIDSGHTDGILVDLGAPVLHRDVAYNCRVLILDRRVLLIRPKADLADHGNYREPRWFRPWPPDRALEQFRLPSVVTAVSAPTIYHAPIGHALVELIDGSTIGCETCEELWTPQSAHIALSLSGATIIGNGSASHHVLRKLSARLELLQSATRKAGGVYLYANQLGCDGGRLYYDGSALVAVNGDVVSMGSQFSISSEVEVVSAVVDLDDVSSYRTALASRGVQAARHQAANPLPRIQVDDPFLLTNVAHEAPLSISIPIRDWRECLPEEEIALGPACWLWDYLRRSGLAGFFLPLSGGADSAATAAIVGAMCQMVVAAVQAPGADPELIADVRRVAQLEDDEELPHDARRLAHLLLHTVYMPCAGSSSSETRKRAQDVAMEIGSFHAVGDISGAVTAILTVFTRVVGPDFMPRFASRGGSAAENLALQNVQARVRMVVGYLCAQLMPWARGRSGGLLVLGSANVDESLRGYLTKYDCSSADLNPIGGISKTDLSKFLRWAALPGRQGLGYGSLERVAEARPTAELEPMEQGARQQSDEEDMGMTYEELSWFGRLRKIGRCGPVSMARKLMDVWRDKAMSAEEIAARVKYFFRMYAVNRHKMTTLTPSYHAEDYSPEDNRFDLRPFVYDVRWRWQFERVDDLRRQNASNCAAPKRSARP